jgi:hypothetical protein
MRFPDDMPRSHDSQSSTDTLTADAAASVDADSNAPIDTLDALEPLEQANIRNLTDGRGIFSSIANALPSKWLI